MTRVLIVDDDAELCDLLREYLAREGFGVDCAKDGVSGAGRAVSGEFDIVVLDVMLPGQSGLEALRAIRRTSEVPVVMLTARGDEVDRVLGLELGADDYLPKPFGPRELVARMRAVLRRGRDRRADDGVRVLERGDLRVDRGARVATRGGEEVVLTGTEFALLDRLASHAGEIVGRDDLFHDVLGRRPTGLDRSLDVHVSNLRRKLGPLPGGRERIKTVRGSGYVYVLDDAGAGTGAGAGAGAAEE
jgi:two-component system response regulator CpxR